jgi:hypothetical protein
VAAFDGGAPERRTPDEGRPDRQPGRDAPLPVWEGLPEVMTVPAAARVLGISPKQLRAWIDADELLWRRLTVTWTGRRHVVTRRLRRWLETSGVTAIAAVVAVAAAAAAVL